MALLGEIFICSILAQNLSEMEARGRFPFDPFPQFLEFLVEWKAPQDIFVKIQRVI